MGCASQGKRQVGTWGWQETQAHMTADVKRNCRAVSLIFLAGKKCLLMGNIKFSQILKQCHISV